MYAHEATCTGCGTSFVVEVAPGQPMRRRGLCNPCRNLRAMKIGGPIAVVVVLIIVIASVCG